MEFELSPDNTKSTPTVPIKPYQWEDVQNAREAGGYPWTHLLKVPIEGVITAEDIIRETTPRRSMSREFSRSRTQSPVDRDVLKILNLDSSPGSSRKHGEEGEDEGIHIPIFSKEVSVSEDDDNNHEDVKAYILKRPESHFSTHLIASVERSKNVYSKGILKRRTPEQYIGTIETREKTKCCHPLVNKIKHLADKTLQKLEKNESEKSPVTKRKKNKNIQEIRQLKNSPGAVRRQKSSTIKLGDSDEVSKSMIFETPPQIKNREHIYEDIVDKSQEKEKVLYFASDTKNIAIESNADNKSNQDVDSLSEKKSNASHDPSLVADDSTSLKPEDYVIEMLHKKDDVTKAFILLDDDTEEPNVNEIFLNQLDELRPKNDSPYITITEIFDDDANVTEDHNASIPIKSSPTPSPRQMERKRNGTESVSNEWSKTSSDHEYEIIEKPPQDITYISPGVGEKSTMAKTDEMSSTTSLERKYLQHISDDVDHEEDKENLQDEKSDDIINAETLQKDLVDRYFTNTPSTASRTECEMSTSLFDSSVLENLPLKRESRTKHAESLDSIIQQRIKEGTGKLKIQAWKLKAKLQNIKTTMPDRPKFKFFDRSKFKMTERSKINLPDKFKFTLPKKRKFNLPDRLKSKKNNISEKPNLGVHKNFALPKRPKFNVPELPKFKTLHRPKINFPSLGRKQEYKIDTNMGSGSITDLRNVASIEFEVQTYPKLFGRKKKANLQKTSSFPTLIPDETSPTTFTFTRMKKTIKKENYLKKEFSKRKIFETTYDFDKINTDEHNSSPCSKNRNAVSIPDISPSKQEYTLINEINNDEFFIRPRGISRENIQVREYLSDEIREAFKIPKNVLASMGNSTKIDDANDHISEQEAAQELIIDDNEPTNYSNEDLTGRDDGYYTFTPVRPSRAKRKKKEPEPIQYIEYSMNARLQFTEVDLGLNENQKVEDHMIENSTEIDKSEQLDFLPPTELHSIHKYANDGIMENPENILIQSQTLPMPPKRKKKVGSRQDYVHSSLHHFRDVSALEWEETQPGDDIIVYRTEHEYTVPQTETTTVTEQSPMSPGRNHSRNSRGTSLCDDDRTSHGAESLTLDTHGLQPDDIEMEAIDHESLGYATVNKNKIERQPRSKTPPARRRKSHSSERKYYTVWRTSVPDRPPRNKSSTSLITLDNFAKRSVSADLTQYVEIDELHEEEGHIHLKSGEVVNKMKDRPLPPPPRPPRESKRSRKYSKSNVEVDVNDNIGRKSKHQIEAMQIYLPEPQKVKDIVEIEVSTQTDFLPDDIDFELGMDENLDVSKSSSLRDIIDEDSILGKNYSRSIESSHVSRPTSRSEKSFKLSDPKIPELSKSSVGRTSPTVILVERRVSSPTRINEREEMLTEVSLTVQHIDVDESQIPDLPPLPKSRCRSSDKKKSKTIVSSNEERPLERVTDENSPHEIQLDNLVTQRLQAESLDVGPLNVSELQSSKILVSDIKGMTLQVAELDSKPSYISVNGIEFSQTVIDEIIKKFAEITTTQANTLKAETQRPLSKEEQTQTEASIPFSKAENVSIVENTTLPAQLAQSQVSKLDEQLTFPPTNLQEPHFNNTKRQPLKSDEPLQLPQSPPRHTEDLTVPPQRPPPPDLSPLLYSYLHNLSLPPPSFYTGHTLRERRFTDFHESQHQSPPPTRRTKRKPAPHSESSSEEDRPRPSPRRMPPPIRTHEPTIAEAGVQLLRVCHSSISRTLRHIFNTFMSYINGAEDKKDVHTALIIFLVLIAGLIMFGLSDSRTIHHHHWEFFNPPDSKQ